MEVNECMTFLRFDLGEVLRTLASIEKQGIGIHHIFVLFVLFCFVGGGGGYLFYISLKSDLQSWRLLLWEGWKWR